MSPSVALDRLHSAYVHPRRVRVLADCLAPLLPAGASLLDVGCGDGRIAQAVAERQPGIRPLGIDVLERADAVIPVQRFDGVRIPFPSAAFDVALCVDVLHHAASPRALLAEAARVGRRVLLKDHLRDGWLAGPTLRLMDRVGNARHGVALPFNYLARREWLETFEALGLTVDRWIAPLPLYPPPMSWVFGRGLHFIALLSSR